MFELFHIGEKASVFIFSSCFKPINMSLFKKIICKVLLVSGLVLPATYLQAQTQSEADAALTAIKSMSPAQVEMMLKMAMNTMPADKRGDMEDALKLMKASKPATQTIKWKKKTIVFVPIAHASTPEFYASVKSIVGDYKAKGYTVFFEQLKRSETAKPRPVPDTVSLKLRKLVGLEPSRQTYAVLKNFFPDIIPQPEYEALGVTKSDLNADVTVEQLVRRYESLYGTINLTACDFDVNKTSLLYDCDKLNNDIEPVILDYRNENVAGLLKSSKTDKILVIYGAKHIPGIIKLLSAG